MFPSPLVYVLIFYQVAIGAPPTSRSEVCSSDLVSGLDTLYQCPDYGSREDDDITIPTLPTLPISEDLMIAGLVLAGLVTLALLVWVLYSYLSQVQQYIRICTMMIDIIMFLQVCFLWVALSCRPRRHGYQEL